MKERKVKIPISEIYPTIQGEGFLIGTPVVLIRLQGCNLSCEWCDTKYAIPLKKESGKYLEEILREVKKYNRKRALITGGEPLYHREVFFLIDSLIQMDFYVQIETNGTLWIEELEKFSKESIYISISPKYLVNYSFHPAFYYWADEVKLVVDNHLSSEVIFSKPFVYFLERKKLILQPEGNKPHFVKKALKLLEEILEKGYEAFLIPQMHKLIGIE
jgi:organic radical activating enzyme